MNGVPNRGYAPFAALARYDRGVRSPVDMECRKRGERCSPLRYGALYDKNTPLIRSKIHPLSHVCCNKGNTILTKVFTKFRHIGEIAI